MTTEAARKLAEAVLIYHGDGVPDRPRSQEHRDTFAEWQRLTGTKRCSGDVLCDLARRVLAAETERGETTAHE